MKKIALGRICEKIRHMDDIDLNLLRLVQRDARQTADALSAEVGLSPPAVQKRLKKLRDNGVIEREVAVLSHDKVGMDITVIVEVSLERENRAFLDGFKRNMRRAPEVQQCYYTTGEADFVLILCLPSLKHYETFTQAHFFDEPNISRFNTMVVMDRVKATLDVL